MSDTVQTILERAERRSVDLHDPQAFLTALLQQTVHDLQLSHLSAWVIPENGPPQQRAACGESRSLEDLQDGLLSAVTGQVTVFSQDDSSEHRFAVSAPVTSRRRLVLTAVRRTAADEPVELAELADVFADLERRRLVDVLETQSLQAAAWEELLIALYGEPDSQSTACVLATDGAVLLPVRRLAVLQRRGSRWQLQATTGVARPDPRSDASRQMTDLVRRTAGEQRHAAPQPPEAHQDRLPDSGGTQVVPLHPSGAWSAADWALVVEWEDGHPQEHDRTDLDRLTAHASAVLAHQDVLTASRPWDRVRQAIRSVGRRRFRTVALFAAAAAVLLAMIPVELRISAAGRLLPVQHHYVFAPDDGTITDLRVDNGQDVSAGDVLCVLSNDDLNVQLETIVGDLAAARARLAAIDALRRSGRSETAEGRLLSAEQAELNVRIASLTEQQEIMTRRHARLTVTAPFSGRIYGERLQQNLTGRPVQRGQLLFEIARPQADWHLELEIPESDVRYVQMALQSGNARPDIRYTLETSPEILRRTQLASLGTAVQISNQGLPVTRATAPVSGSSFRDERPGTGVFARISCGRRALGFVWLRRLIELFQRHVWLGWIVLLMVAVPGGF